MDEKKNKALEGIASGWQKLCGNLAKLVDVKSIVTLVMTVALVVLLFNGTEPSKELLALYCTSFGAVITYFFTRKEG